MSGLNGYTQLRRGILAHLYAFSSAEWKVYSALLMAADPRTGIYRFAVRDFAEQVGMSATSVCRCLRSLHDERTVITERGDVQRRYIEYTPASNQHSLNSARILNFKRSAVPTNDTAEEACYTASGTAAGQQRDSSGIAAVQHNQPEQGKEASYSLKALEPDSQEKKILYEDAPKSASLYAILLKTWERVTMSVPSEASKRVIRGMAEMGYSEHAVESALKVAVANEAKSPAEYAKKVLMNGSTREEYTPDGVSIESLRQYDNA